MTFRMSALPRGLQAREVRRLASYLTRKLRLSGEISIAFVPPRRMQQLNYAYRGKRTATDVLSFSFRNADSRLLPRHFQNKNERGEILFCARELYLRARKNSMTMPRYFYLLLIHSVLHLQGFDHETNRDAVRMEKKEAVFLAGFAPLLPEAAALKLERKAVRLKQQTRKKSLTSGRGVTGFAVAHR
ncbi:MAG: rRNA maturation RNase YbeY [Candidatus Komeilibacteria bacterium RIFCSPLOWO2_01_FULL_52_15]|uniref:Endoribonuclease YbeY n=2 Tax=Candidatus Komeiliibacteriota TaxID=1817908 RepID=A0A1G2BPC5_9BACT|nr:MAG: rRNA maturation RNase YbeY [Candidatus Komeilibacteria bacterium RIFCSPHIGHO2_01_FULL_52_14]OGY90636.1 MAG: rRNA maturation RNase YbeY [Candidatus Komeilibacteria bacterium RIFCSPLOWO2_01_FULL_52_15]